MVSTEDESRQWDSIKVMGQVWSSSSSSSAQDNHLTVSTVVALRWWNVLSLLGVAMSSLLMDCW